MKNVEELKKLYVALGGSAADVENDSTIVAVLNAIAAKYDGDANAVTNPEGIANITAVIDKIAGGGNPNYIQTICSSLSDLWNNIDLSELKKAIQYGNATVYIDGKFQDERGQMLTFGSYMNQYLMMTGGTTNNDTFTGYFIAWQSNGYLSSCDYITNGVVYSCKENADISTASVRIHWHPMP